MGFLKKKQSWKNFIKICMALDDKDTVSHCLVFVRHFLQEKTTEMLCWRGALSAFKGVLVETQGWGLWSHWNAPCTLNQLRILSAISDQMSAGLDNISRIEIKPELEDGTSRSVGWQQMRTCCSRGHSECLISGWEPALGRAGFISKVPCRPDPKFVWIDVFSDLC